jgi:hypothetical protein
MSKNKKVSKNRKLAANIVSLLVAAVFIAVVSLILEARYNNFYEEPLPVKMAQILDIKINGLPEDPEQRARVITGIPNLYLLPPEAVLPEYPAARFKRIGTQFGYLTSDAQLGTKYRCRASQISRIPNIAINIAIGLEKFSEDLLRRVNLEYIVFCGDLLTPEGRAAGLPAPPNNLMFLSLTNRFRDSAIQDLFFHEFYHLFEARFGLVRDPLWLEYFDAGYLYSFNGMMSPQYSKKSAKYRGFLNNYSRTFPYEDRATIFAALMTSKEELVYVANKKRDRLLKAKIDYVSATAKHHLGIDFGPLWKR